MGTSPFAPPFGAPSIGRGMNSSAPTPFGGGVNPMMGANPYGMSPAGVPNNGAPNVDELVKKIDAQIAKLEEEERLEKEKLAQKKNGEKVNEANEFEKLINKKYEDYKLGEEQKNNLVKEDKPMQVNPAPVVPPVQDIFGSNPYNPQPFNPGMPGSSVSVDDLIKKIDAKIAELEKEEEEERRKEEAAKASSKPEIEKEENSVKDDKTNELRDKGEFPNPFRLEEMNPFASNVVKDVPVTETKREEIPNLADLMKTENVKPPIEKINDNLIQEEEKIEKPLINIDVNSIVTNDNVTDDEFFDDFFGDDDF